MDSLCLRMENTMVDQNEKREFRLMDVCLISDVKRHQIVRLAKKYQEGTHTQYKNLVSMYQAKTIHLNTENEMIYANMDGEVKGFKNPTIEIVEKAIRLALPRIS